MIKDTYLPKISILAIASTPLRGGLQFEKGVSIYHYPPKGIISIKIEMISLQRRKLLAIRSYPLSFLPLTVA
jgi:hypothetical protein